jgi:hypothetical protein
MESPKYILGMPEYVDRVGEIYPVKIKDYDKFSKCASILQVSKKMLEGKVDDDSKLEQIDLLDIILQLSAEQEGLLDDLVDLLSLVLKSKIRFSHNQESYCFRIDENNKITPKNFDEVREIIMKQNLLHEPKVFKSPLVQKWAEKVLKAREKNAANITFEDMITTVAALAGKNYYDIGEYTIYQLKAEFGRIVKDKAYHTAWYQIIASQGSAKVDIEHFAESLDLFKNPYDDLFKNSDKLTNMNKAIQGDGK